MTKDYWVCYHCGLQLDRRNEWEMIQADSHLDKHNNKESNYE